MLTGIGCARPALDSKASAIDYAISMATNLDKNDKKSIDLVLAAGIYNFITERVNLPDLPKDALAETYTPLLEVIKNKLDKLSV
jgi:hypothetical protein